MASAKDKITAIAVEHGYAGKKPKSVAGAINALADTLAGEDVKNGRSISDAVDAIAPYIGSGGGGGAKLGELVNLWRPIPMTAPDAPAALYRGIMFRTPIEPVVGENTPTQLFSDFKNYSVTFCRLSSGSQDIVSGVVGDDVSAIASTFAAAGLTAMCYISADYVRIKSGIKLYRCKVELVDSGSGINAEYTSVSEFTDFTVDEEGYITFVIPDLGQNDALVFCHDA